MKKHLNICIEIEETVGEIYRLMAKSQLLSSEVRKVLLELANDEAEHANQLKFALRFPEGSVLNSAPEMLQQAEKMLLKAKDALAKIEKLEMNDRQALNIGIELEKHFCQAHIATSFNFKDESYRSMFAAMAKEDERHCQLLEDLAQQICNKNSN
jgi:rubrerythrin